ncbi:hypothetical protein MB02_09590 [Croceicoccus estronivorus]|uniref:DUF445 domain-containing protein n=1 Tax=Croceicoccus estronivorus TaxID=1172626 RepID=UPI00082C468D|nr:DUF445 domain-containing protein [Croceicoccus estronivorus]OCC24139.1 hypothetical protein MB02_09590 [Croceicoccus estronivorus]
MRLTATGLLLLMAALFLLARHNAGLHPAWGYLLAFSEAAMVGGFADWFAVTALFRRPLGLPIPHTAIIPENKDRIADTMAVFLRENFLTPQVVARRLRGMNLAATAGRFLAENRTGERRLRDGATGLMADILRSLDQNCLGGMVKEGLRAQLHKIEVAPLVGQMIGAAIADRRHLPVMDSAIRWIGRTLEENEELVRSIIAQRANRLFQLTGLDARIANAVLDGMYKLLAECAVQPDHPLRHRVEEGLQDLAHGLQHDLALRAKVEAMKLELLADPAVGYWLDGLWERSRAALLRAVDDPEQALSGQFGAMLAELGGALERDQRLQLLINRFARRTLVGVASRYGGQIVQLVSETVRRWDARTVTGRIEMAVGRDLQFIRINGTMVGGMVGLGLHFIDGIL